MRKTIFVCIAALLVMTLFAGVYLVSAEEGLTDAFSVTIDGSDYEAGDIVGIESGNTIPVAVSFKAIEDASDVKLKVEIDGYRSDISDSTGRFELVDGSKYTEHFSLTVPSDVDPTEDYVLIVRISDKTSSHEEEFSLKLQRESYKAEVLNVEMPERTTPGSNLPVSVVLKNRGMHELEDVFVKVSIPELGVSKRVYFSDLVAEDDDDEDEKDSAERMVYLYVPTSAKAGTYRVEVEAYNLDFSETVKKNLIISGQEETSQVVSGVTGNAVSIGGETSFDLILVNTGDNVKVYTLTPAAASGLIIEVDPIVTVAAGSSEKVKVNVRATDSAEEGTHTVVINVESNGELVKSSTFSVNVEKGKKVSANSVFVLTVVLAVIFLVLLIVLIVLLTKKPAMSETEETSYY